jgi:FAD:protein FMN transferase
MPVAISRRRFIAVSAVAVGAPLLAMGVGRAEARPWRWEGHALGAPASITLYHSDPTQARAAITAGLAELDRLEGVFSLYRPESALSALNRDGVLTDAPADLLSLLSRALTLAEVSDGVYDPTVQPLWRLYLAHFTSPAPDPAGPNPAATAAALALVDWRAVEVDPDRRRVALARPGMALTLNSGAQGYITDRVAEILRAHGFDRMLVDMGEPRALAAKPDGSAWRIAIANPADPARSVATLEVVDRCVATSGGYGTLFDPAGRFTHILDPRTGGTAPALAGVSVVAATATLADGLATAMLLAPAERRRAILRAAGGIQAIYVNHQGVTATVEAGA